MSKTTRPHVVAARVSSTDRALIDILASSSSTPVSTLLADVVREGVRARLRQTLDDDGEAADD